MVGTSINIASASTGEYRGNARARTLFPSTTHRTCINTLNVSADRLSQPLNRVSHRVRKLDKLPATEKLRLRAALQRGLLFDELGEEGNRRVSEDIEHRACRTLPQLPVLRAFPRLRKDACRRHSVRKKEEGDITYISNVMCAATKCELLCQVSARTGEECHI